MLEIDIKAKYGILFVRLFGNLTKKEIGKFEKEVEKLIEETGIHNLVINIKNIKKIDETGIKKLIKCYQKCNSVFCINGKMKKFKNYKYVEDEIAALKLIKI